MGEFTRDLPLNDIKGLLPSLHNAKVTDPRVLRGRNFDFTIDGPRSGFGDECLNHNRVDHDCHTHVFTIDDTQYQFVCGVVLSYDALCADYNPVFSYAPTECDCNHPWSIAFVGCAYYVSHPCVPGLLKYCTESQQWSMVDLASQCFDGCIYGVTQSNGRLVVLASDTVSWSEIDHGDRLDVNLHKGAGFQNLGEILAGKPLGVYEVATGFLTYTTKGVMKSDHVNIIDVNDIRMNAVWKHSRFEIGNVPLSAFCIAHVPDKLIQYVLTKRGFFIFGQYANNQVAYDRWETEFDRYYVDKMLPQLAVDRQPDMLKLWYVEDQDRLYVSEKHDVVATNWVGSHAAFYDFVFQKWGSFDREHQFIGVAFSPNGRFSNIEHGFIDVLGRPYLWNCGNTRDDAHESACTFSKCGLDSYVEIGPLRLNDEKYYDRTTVVTEVAIASSPQKGGTNEINRTTHTYTFVDAYEEGLEKTSEFGALIAGSLDAGYTGFEDQQEKLWPREVRNRTHYFVCDNTGIHHTVMIQAVQEEQYYSVATINLTARLGGRL